MWENERSTEKELLDLGPDHYTDEEYNDCLKKLSRINSLLGGFGAMKKALKAIKPRSFLDVGCGAGVLCQKVAHWFNETSIMGIDLNPKAIEKADRDLPDSLRNQVSFQCEKSFPSDSFDVVTSMLVAHHFTDDELVVFIQENYRMASKFVIINDLQRHVLAYASFSILVPFLFPNRLIWHDGRLSIKRGFRKNELHALLHGVRHHLRTHGDAGARRARPFQRLDHLQADRLELALAGVAEFDLDRDRAGAGLDALYRARGDEILAGVGIDERCESGLNGRFTERHGWSVS